MRCCLVPDSPSGNSKQTASYTFLLIYTNVNGRVQTHTYTHTHDMEGVMFLLK